MNGAESLVDVVLREAQAARAKSRPQSVAARAVASDDLIMVASRF